MTAETNKGLMTTMPEERLWKEIILQLGRELDEKSLANWFSTMKLKTVSDQAVIIESPNSFISDWVKRNYQKQLHTAAMTAIGRELPIEFVINPKLAEPSKSPEPSPAGAAALQPAISSAAGLQPPTASAAGLQPAIAEPKRPAAAPGLTSSGPSAPYSVSPKYTFDSFVVGRSNQFAYAACQAVAEKNAHNYNPLFIYGGVGLGKTHLMSAVGNRILERNGRAKVISIQAETFMNEMIHALRNERMEAFRKRFRKDCDVLLMDDIEIIAGKERTQEEFFYTFNELYLAGKKIVMTSDKFPKEMTTLEERLKSRFESGIIVDIQPPEFETRLSIIRHIARTDNIILPDDVAIYMAERIKSNIRKLEGSLIRLSAVASLSGSPPTIEMAKDVIMAVTDDPRASLSSDDVMKIVSAYFKIKVSDLKSPKRNRKFAVPRQIAAFFCREYCSMSYPEIGSAFGGRDHSTIIHSCRKIGLEKNTDPELARHLEALARELKNHM
jgi:chromosomal replication initiator protein